MTERWCYTDQFQDGPLAMGFAAVPYTGELPPGYLDLGEMAQIDAYAAAESLWFDRSRHDIPDAVLLGTVHKPVDESYRL